ncbi:response regulator transcription factor [Sandarakinorhabdus rubra]|uniref:response regulator transcription factor n=1 Tax=Sandarakinorhabdus rubra TaxID=2672568 RepID=UPI0013DCC6E8|nr:response regulator transcription factor [Sandarakinorhabdus rubra]
MRIGLLHADSGEASRLAQTLAQAGYSPIPFDSGQTLEQAVRQQGLDLLLMRWDGHVLSGVALAHRVRQQLATPPGVILLVDDGAPGGIGEIGDAALPDPCREGDLIGCIEALAAQRGLGRESASASGMLRFDDGAAVVEVGGMPVQLTAKEFALAQLLLRRIGQPLSRDEIMTSVWGRREQPGSRTLDAHIAQVRKRLLLRPEHGWRLSSVYGYGYRLDRIEPQVDAEVTGQAA